METKPQIHAQTDDTASQDYDLTEFLEDYGIPFAFALTFICLLFTVTKYC